MRFVYVQKIDSIINDVADVLSSHLLSGKNVAWFLSGGSAIELEVRIALALQAYDTSRLYTGLIDERYGPLGHKDENYSQLLRAGFPLPIQRVLSEKPPEEIAADFGAATKQALRGADYSLGIFGIGTDGHTAGIKPNSPAVTAAAPALFYEWEDYQRITITPPTIRQFDEAIIYAFGDEKTETLQVLLQKSMPIEEQPAQVLKDIRTSTLYTDNALNSAEQANK